MEQVDLLSYFQFFGVRKTLSILPFHLLVEENNPRLLLDLPKIKAVVLAYGINAARFKRKIN